jgi:hypothetical protein
MTDFPPSTHIRYFTGLENVHYTAIVLKNKKLLSVKCAGKKDKTTYDTFEHWLNSIPGNITVADLDIEEPIGLNYISFRSCAPNYDLFRFLLTYETYKLKNSLPTTDNVTIFESFTYVANEHGDLHPVKYNRYTKKLYSVYHKTFGSDLVELGFPPNAPIYVKVQIDKYCKWQRDTYYKKMTFPFTPDNYTDFYDTRCAFILNKKSIYWPDYKQETNYHYDLIYKYLEDKGYTIFIYHIVCFTGSYSIFSKQFEGNVVTIRPSFKELLLTNYNDGGFMKIPLIKDTSMEEVKYFI